MSETLVDKIARAVLYEGYILYPYRPCVKSRQRWTFGGIFPRAYSEAPGSADPCLMQAQCLLTASPAAQISITLRFLHLTDRILEQAPDFNRVESLRIANAECQSWQEAVEREIRIHPLPTDALCAQPLHHPFSFPRARTVEPLHDGSRLAARFVREQQSLAGAIELAATPVAAGLLQLTARIVNETPIRSDHSRDHVLLRSFASTHIVLHAHGGEFLSLTDPPAPQQPIAAQCHNIGCWPVLVGEAGQTHTLLASPIILPDYPRIAPESPGDLFDGCEIDEILSLRIQTLTDAEKQQAASVDDRVRRMLQRTESLARDQMMNLHGTVRTLHPVAPSQPSHQPEEQHA